MDVRVIQAFRVCQFVHVSVLAFHGDPAAMAHQIPTEPSSVGPRYTNPLSKWARFLPGLVFILLLEFLSSP